MSLSWIVRIENILRISPGPRYARIRSAAAFARCHATAHRYGLFRLLELGHERTYSNRRVTRKNVRLTPELQNGGLTFPLFECTYKLN